MDFLPFISLNETEFPDNKYLSKLGKFGISRKIVLSSEKYPSRNSVFCKSQKSSLFVGHQTLAKFHTSTCHVETTYVHSYTAWKCFKSISFKLEFNFLVNTLAYHCHTFLEILFNALQISFHRRKFLRSAQTIFN